MLQQNATGKQNIMAGKFDITRKDLCIALMCSDIGALDFAAQELQRYLYLAYGVMLPIVEGMQDDNTNAVVLACSGNNSAYGSSAGIFANSRESDEFSISCCGNKLEICGPNHRAVLFGVYRFLEEYTGIRWANPEAEYIPYQAPRVLNISDRTYKPDFAKRGLVLENSESLEYILKIIDWMAKNYYNSMFFTFHLWESHKEILRNEIKKRGLLLTLGGHNINLFIPGDRYYENNPDWFALYNGSRIDAQPCFSSEAGTDMIIGNILKYCDSEEVIDEICIWPNDNRFTCRCDSCVKTGFISTYIKFLERLKAKVKSKGLSLNVQHIAYNAQIEWEMLEEIPEEDGLDTLIACWGRDYRHDMANPGNPFDIRFKKAVEGWADACNNKFGTRLSIFEYYGDYWMMTGLFPPLLNTIIRDVDFFRKLGVYEVKALIVPHYLPDKIIHEEFLHKELPGDAASYEYNSESAVLWFNLYALARKTWDLNDTYGDIMESYCAVCFGTQKDFARTLLESLEQNIAGLSAYNKKFFSLNFKTVWLRDDWLKIKSISKRASSEIKEWSPQDDDPAIPGLRADTCLEIVNNMQQYAVAATKCSAGLDQMSDRNFCDLAAYYNYVCLKIKSIYHQSAAQTNIIEGDTRSAVENLSVALEIEASIKGWDEKECDGWFKKLKMA